MQFSKQAMQRFTSRQSRRVRLSEPNCSIQALEPRRMFDGETIAVPLAPILAHPGAPATDSVTLNQHFNDTTLPGTLVTFTTTQGTIQVGLTDAATPQTVANFLSYVNSGAYNDTIFHRSVNLNTGKPATPEAPATIIQGGGYNISNGTISHIPTGSPVADEYTREIYHDVAGTLAMAKTSQANSATSEWYFNTADNTELDTPTTDSNGVQTSYTVFGQILGSNSATAVDTIAALPTYSLGAGSGLDTIPVAGITEAQIQAGQGINANNLVFVQSVTAEAGTNYTVSSDNPSLVTPVVTNGVLSFTYGSGFGTAAVTIVGKNLDGTSATTKVLVTIPNSATPSAGPVAVNATAPFTVTGTTGNFPILSGSTDSLAALNPAAVNIVTSPTHGTASVDTSDGYINYTPNAGYVGSDSLTYTVADANGAVSNIATVTLDAVPTAVKVTVGAAGVKSLNFTQPDGTVGHLSVVHGSAVITFTNFQVNLSGPTNGVLSASGPGTTITSVVVTDQGTNAALNVSAARPVTLGTVQDVLHLSINAPQATLTGNCFTGSSDVINIAALNNATLKLGLSPVHPVLDVGSVADSNVSSQTEFISINSNQWVNTDRGTYTLTAPGIQFMNVPGEFDEALNLSGQGYDIFFAKVGHPNAAWNMAGSIFKVQTQTPASGWSISSNGLIHALHIQGDLANTISAAAIATLVVTGNTNNATIQTSAGYLKKFVQVGAITFQGGVSNTVVFSAGNVGSITAASFTDSRIYAGVNISLAQSGSLAASATDLSANAKINSVVLKNGGSFSGSEISADIIGSLNLGKVVTTANNLPEGVSAHTIGAVSATLSPGGALRVGPPQLKTTAALAAYVKLKKLTLTNFSINLF